MRITRKLLQALGCAVIFLASPSHAEVTWIAEIAPYSISGADLFKLRNDLPANLQESLRDIRNQVFEGEAAFRAALDPLLISNELRDEWADKLVARARQHGVAYGIEQRENNIATLVVAGTDHQFDRNPFTSKSWLSNLPPPSETGAFEAKFVDGCLHVASRGADLFSLCGGEVGGEQKSVKLQAPAHTIVGLGQQFDNPGDTGVNRIGSVRDGSNHMGGFNGAANGNTLFPIAYFDRPGQPFALFLDNRYPQEWDLSVEPFVIAVKGGDMRLHVLTGNTLADIRRQYMQLTGTPPVPPKSAFGLWISEYGYDNWDELDAKIASLESNGFPLSGVVMDLQWFGGIGGPSGASHMGSLTWDRTSFPAPEEKIADYAGRGIAMMLIEESYVDKSLSEFAELARRGYMAHDAKAGIIMTSPAGQWWGHGGMLDWAKPQAGAFWHDYRRQALVDMGIAGHWTDLGEPEMFSPSNLYADILTPSMVHNSYNLLWLQSIADGYRRNSPDKRAFMMSRSGGVGMQALGASMWSGDIGGDYFSLASQMAQQTHMMWSGMDYYGSDIGGFHRGALRNYDGAPSREAAMNALYTQWFAYSALFEVPVRPHTENLCNCKQTAPDRIGDLKSNLANIKLRQSLLPYYYSLAHAAWLNGEPVFPSINYWHPDAPSAQNIGATKMIGRDLIGAGVARYGGAEAKVYLPPGVWFDYRTGKSVQSQGGFTSDELDRDGIFSLPLYARDGAMVPVDQDGGKTIRIYGLGQGEFSWYDDDGRTTAYQNGQYDRIDLSKSGSHVMVTRVRGEKLAPSRIVWFLPPDRPVASLQINGMETPFQVANGILSAELPLLKKSLNMRVGWE